LELGIGGAVDFTHAAGAELAWDAVGSEYNALRAKHRQGAGGSSGGRRDMVPSRVLQQGIRLALVSQ
jgi:hypothetical protein